MSDLEKLGGMKAIELELAARNAMSPDHDRRRHNGIPVSNCMICIAQSLIARVKELERTLEAFATCSVCKRRIVTAYAIIGLECHQKSLQAARELAEMVRVNHYEQDAGSVTMVYEFDHCPNKLCSKAREFLEGLK